MAKKISPVELLTQLRQHLENPEEFAVGALAKDASGQVVSLVSDNAVSRCTYGWIDYLTGGQTTFGHPGEGFLSLTCHILYQSGIASVNDSPDGRAKMIRAIDTALERLEAQRE